MFEVDPSVEAAAGEPRAGRAMKLREIGVDDVAVYCANEEDRHISSVLMTKAVVGEVVRRGQLKVSEFGLLRREGGPGQYVYSDEKDGIAMAMVESTMVDVVEYTKHYLGRVPGCRMSLVDTMAKGNGPAINKEWVGTLSAWTNAGGASIDKNVRRIMGQLASLEEGRVEEDPPRWPLPVYWRNVVYEIGNVPPPDATHARSRGPEVRDSFGRVVVDGEQIWHWVRPYRDDDVVCRRTAVDWVYTGDLHGGRSVDVHETFAVAGAPDGDGWEMRYLELPEWGSAAETGWFGEMIETYFSEGSVLQPSRLDASVPVEQKTYEVKNSLCQMFAECFVHRPQQLGLVLAGRPGAGKTILTDLLLAVLGRISGGGTLGAETRNKKMLLGLSTEHSTVMDSFRGTTALVAGDLGDDLYFTSALVDYIATSTGVPYRKSHQDAMRRNLTNGCTIIYNINGDGGSSPNANDWRPWERRLMRIPTPMFLQSDIESMLAEIARCETTGIGHEMMQFVEWLMGLLQRGCWRGQDSDNEPFREAIGDGFFEKMFVNNLFKELGLMRCEWGFREDGTSYGIVSDHAMNAYLEAKGNQVDRRGNTSALRDATEAMGDLCLTRVNTMSAYRTAGGTRAPVGSSTNLFFGWHSPIAGDAVSVNGVVAEKVLRRAIADAQDLAAVEADS